MSVVNLTLNHVVHGSISGSLDGMDCKRQSPTSKNKTNSFLIFFFQPFQETITTFNKANLGVLYSSEYSAKFLLIFTQ